MTMVTLPISIHEPIIGTINHPINQQIPFFFAKKNVVCPQNPPHDHDYKF